MEEHPAGFWVRFAAWWLDAAISFGVVNVIAGVARYGGVYIPFELTFVLLMLLCFTVFTALIGKTPGKAVCGLRVLSTEARRPSLLSVVIRECIGKPLSAVCFLLGFLSIAVSKRKRGWHDYLGRTQVIRQGRRTLYGRLGIVAGLSVAGIVVGGNVYAVLSVRLTAHEMAVPSTVKSRYADRDPASLATLSSLKDEMLTDWLEHNGRDAADYAVDAAAKHDVTLFGEGHHGSKRYLTLFNEILPDLYHKAGVTCVALEACPSFNNKALERLVTAPEFDRDLALRIARSELWRVTGYQEYWDIFETVWNVNQGIPEDQTKMRVVGLEVDADGPSWALLGLGDDGLANAPVWEKLRAFRMTSDIARLVSRDELMARTIEKEILEKGARGVVLVGGNHAYLHYGQPAWQGTAEKRRMGYMLHQRHGDRIFHVMLYDEAIRWVFPDGFGELMAAQERASIGFDVAGSPFELLHAGPSSQTGVCLVDVAPGVIYIESSGDDQRSKRIPGFITKEMLLQHKPYYEAIAGRSLKTAQEANEYAE